MELLHKNSYENLLNRITPRGYAVTSLTGLYVGMFPRDSSIQVMSHLAHKDNEAARRILRYILSYHAALDLDRTAHIIDEINDEEYRNTYLIKRDSSLGDFFISQRKDSQDIYCLNAPNNCACQSFIPKNEYIYAVDVSLSNTEATDEVWVEIREDYKNASTKVSWGSSIGTIIIYLIAPILISISNWRSIFLFSAVSALVMIFVWNRYCPDIPRENNTVSGADKERTGSPLFKPVMLFIMVGIILTGMLRDGVTT